LILDGLRRQRRPAAGMTDGGTGDTDDERGTLARTLDHRRSA
jgi:hypothetical protein